MALKLDPLRLAELKMAMADFEPFVARHNKGVWRYLRLIGCTPDEADDLTQDTFIAIFRSGMRDMGDAAAAAYLRTTARRLFVDLRRRENRLPANADLDAAEAVWAGAAPDDSGEAQLSALRDCLQRLAPRAQEALRLFYGSEAGRRDVGLKLGITEDGVRNLLARARATLRECLEARLA